MNAKYEFELQKCKIYFRKFRLNDLVHFDLIGRDRTPKGFFE